MPLNKKIELFLRGSAHPTIIAMCYIFIFSAVFTYTLNLIGGIQSAVTIGMYALPSSFLLPGFFILVSLFATAIGSSMGAIAAFLPIGIGMAKTIGIDPSLMAGIVVSGAMLGDNLSIISDTTIAATQTTGTPTVDKFKSNVLLVIPAFICTVATITWINSGIAVDSTTLALTTPTWADGIKVAPYILVFAVALTGLDVIPTLLLGIFAAAGVGMANGMFTFTRATSLILEGFAHDSGGIQEILILVLLVGGLSYIVEYNGGIAYMLKKCSRHANSKAGAEFTIVLLVFVVNAALAINTIAILVTGPVAKKIGDQAGLEGKRVASLLDVVACITQGILPYGPQLLLAGSLAGVSSVSIMPHLHYQGFILLVTLASIGYTHFKN